MNYNAKVSFAFYTPKGSNGVAVQTVNVKKKSDVHIIVALEELLGIANYKILNVEWE